MAVKGRKKEGLRLKREDKEEETTDNTYTWRGFQRDSRDESS